MHDFIFSEQLGQASVHGRFQIFHNDHLAYLRSAFDLAEFVYIGLTHVPGLASSETDEHRTRLRNNPLSFWERSEMIRECLVSEGISESRFALTPFPIEMPTLLPEFVPTNITCFTTIREEWNQKKVNTLRGLGYQVRVLYEDYTKTISSTLIREKIRTNDESWFGEVPAAVREWLSRNSIAERLKA